MSAHEQKVLGKYAMWQEPKVQVAHHGSNAANCTACGSCNSCSGGTNGCGGCSGNG